MRVCAPYHAQIGPHTLLPFPDESDAAFLDRALDTAADLGESFVVIGGTTDGPLGGISPLPERSRAFRAFHP